MCRNASVSIHYTMSISRQNLSIVIVTLKSEKVINQCIESIEGDLPIIVVENSTNSDFKKYLEEKYKNVKCILSGENLGMGSANNIGIKLATTNYVYILNPDTTLEKNTLNEIFLVSEKLEDFSILSPICSDKSFPNYGISNKQYLLENDLPFKVDYVDGFSMLLNKSKFKNDIFFDENFFMYLENNDLCKKVIDDDGSIYIIPTAKVNHAGGKTVDQKFHEEIELSRNWHWIWSKFYYNKKNFGFFYAIKSCGGTYVSSLLKFIFYLILGNSYKRKINFNRASGFYNALLGKASWYRPNIKD